MHRADQGQSVFRKEGSAERAASRGGDADSHQGLEEVSPTGKGSEGN